MTHCDIIFMPILKPSYFRTNEVKPISSNIEEGKMTFFNYWMIGFIGVASILVISIGFSWMVERLFSFAVI